ncbi:hypothetical protein CRUP_006640 [Coryphaenoides rupestris]|nr:hypothetical protein CRUP_006640 [Coryphaenoides rupestris]
MDHWLELAALGLGVSGWLCSVFTRCLALWTVSGTVDNATATLPAYWDGVWLDWDHWDLGQDGSLHCSFYQRLMSLSGNFRTWRALVVAAIGAGAAAVAVGAAGVVWCPRRAGRLRVKVKVASGALFIAAALLLLVPVAWTCHHTGRPLEGAEELRRVWGPALYMGWVSFGLMVAAGAAFLVIRCPGPGASEEAAAAPPVGRLSEQEDNPLNTIQRTAFTNSQYGRMAQPL